MVKSLRWMMISATALAGGVGMTAACGAKPADKDAANTEQARRRAEVPCIRPITMAAVGDVLLHGPFQRWAAAQPEGFFAAMRPVQDLIEGADVAVANLEGPAAENIARGSNRELATPAARYDDNAYTGYPLFNYHPSIVTDLKRMGFDMLQNGNNHAMDRGVIGADRTIRALDAAGMPHTGVRLSTANPTGYRWSTSYTVTRNGHDYRFAFIACSFSTNGVPDPHRQVLRCYDDRDELLAQVRALHADQGNAAVIVMPHWGVEYTPRPDANQTRLAQELADAGATAIIGTHPHVVEPEAMLTTPDGRRVPVVYSLGNFVSYQQGLPRLATVIYLLGFTPTAEGRLAATLTGWIPLRMLTGGTARVDALDRLGAGEAAPYRAHIAQTFRADNRLPADAAAYWSRTHAPVCAPGR